MCTVDALEIRVSLTQVASIIQSAEEGFQRTGKLLQQLGEGRPLGGTPPSEGLASKMALIQKCKVIYCFLSSQLATQHQHCPLQIY